MDKQITIATAGNVLPSALAVLKSMGYVVEKLQGNDALIQAKKPGFQLIAEDTLLLLGLATLAHARGAEWRPSDSEVDALLAIDEASSE